MDIQIKTNRRDTRLKLVQAPRGKVEDTLSQSSCSPTSSARTPTLVARLMGLDILPESNNTTPRSSSSYSHITPSTPPSRATRTRPKSSSYNNDHIPSPRPKTVNTSSPSSTSSQRRRSTDVIDQHRLSLQINKENNIVKEMELSRPSCSAINTKRREGRKYEDENKSPGYYARQIMKQVKETVSRRVGADITNTIQQRDVRRDEHLLSKTPLKSKKSRKEASLLSTSPKLVKTSETISSKVSGKQSNSVLQEMGRLTNMDDKLHLKPLRRENEKFDMDLKKVGGTGTTNKPSSKIPPKSYDYSIKNKKDEQFVRSITRVHSSNTDKKCKKTPLSSDLVHASVPSIISLKKDSSSQEGASRGQVSKLNNISTATRLFRSPSQQIHRKANKEATDTPAVHEYKDNTSSTSTSTSLAECQYISKILKCTGIDRDTPVSFTKWFSPSHPLDPTIYHTLEAAHYLTTTNPNRSSSDANLSLLLNRKLIFHLVDEILADILKPYRKFKPFHNRYHHQKPEKINGFQLVKLLCNKLQSFPSKDCQTLQDIDALVEQDMPRIGEASDFVAFEDESEAIVVEIEGDIIDSLVQEMAMSFLSCSIIRSSMQR